MASFLPVFVSTPNAFVFFSSILATCITHFISIEENTCILASIYVFEAMQLMFPFFWDVATRYWMIDA
jgi:hypothetical protein